MKALKIAGAVVFTLIVVAVLLSIVGIPSGFLASAIEARVERDTGYQLTISGTTKVGLWPSPNVTLKDIRLQNPGHQDRIGHLTVERVRADLTLASLWSGHPHITELRIDHPVLYVPLLRQRDPQPAPRASPAASGGGDESAAAIDHVTMSDGAIEFSNAQDHVDERIEGINADAVIGGDRKVRVTGGAHAGEHPLTFGISAAIPAPPLERQNIPVELNLDMPGVLRAPLSAKAEVRLNGSIVAINGLTGKLGDDAFNGWASADIASKPLVKLDLDFQRLAVASASSSQNSEPLQSWSDTPIGLKGLNYVDAELKVSAAALDVGTAHFAPAAVDATLASGVLKARVANLAAYGGQANGDLAVDVSAGDPTYTLRSDINGVRALPLLNSLAGFDKLDGKMQANVAVRSSGGNLHAIMSNLAGTASTTFSDGAIRGLNVAQMIRSLTSGTLSGWQETREQSTDLTQLAASFQIEKGQAATSDLNLVGPLVRMTGTGTVDLAAKSLAFRVEPKLVMTTEGQGRTSDPVGLGIPVVIDGPWSEPRIYPDMAGILDHPDEAYARLKEMGKGLFGNGAGAGNASGDDGAGSGSLGETLGNLIQQGLNQSRNARTPGSSPGDPSPQSTQDADRVKDIMKQLFGR